MRSKSVRIIEPIHSKGVFGYCSCAGESRASEVLYYTDQGVRCSTCGKLYAVWANRPGALLERVKETLGEETSANQVYSGVQEGQYKSSIGKIYESPMRPDLPDGENKSWATHEEKETEDSDCKEADFTRARG